MALTWKRSEIATKVRKITGKLTTEDISASALNDRINDYYRNVFPLEVYVAELENWFTQTTTTGIGEYAVSQDYARLDTPMTILDADDILTTVKFYQDKDEFFNLYPEDPSAVEGKPAATLLYGGVLYFRPVPDLSTYDFKAACTKKPDVLSGDDSVPPDVRWGPAIAYGTAIEILIEDNDRDAANELMPIYQYFLSRISQKKMVQRNVNQRAVPRF